MKTIILNVRCFKKNPINTLGDTVRSMCSLIVHKKLVHLEFSKSKIDFLFSVLLGITFILSIKLQKGKFMSLLLLHTMLMLICKEGLKQALHPINNYV